MKTIISTESGSIYELEDGYVTRLSEFPIRDRNSGGILPDVFNWEKLEYWDDPIVGERWFFATTKGGRITTSTVFNITVEDDSPFAKGFDRAER